MSEHEPTGPARGFDPRENRGFGQVCRVRPPIAVDFEGGRIDGKTQLAQEGDDLTLNGGTLAVNWLSVTVTNGGDYTSTLRKVLIAFCNNNFDVDSHAPFPRSQQILLSDTVANAFVKFDSMPVPRDFAGPLLKALRIRVDAGLGVGQIQVGLVELYGVSR